MSSLPDLLANSTGPRNFPALTWPVDPRLMALAPEMAALLVDMASWIENWPLSGGAGREDGWRNLLARFDALGKDAA